MKSLRLSIINVPASRRRTRRTTRGWIRVGRSILLFTVMMMILGLTGCLERFAYAPSGGTASPPAGVVEVYFEATDGIRLHGWFAAAETPRMVNQPDQPPTLPSKNAPTVLVIHGNAGNVSNHYGFVESLPRLGFNVFIFDYRSYGLSAPGKLRRDNLMKDTEGALAYLLNRADLDPQQIVLYAQSLGGTFGARLMAEHPEIKAGVFLSTFTSWQEIAVSVLGASGNPGALARGIGRILLRSGLDPIVELPRITERAVLIVHGTADRVVPFAHGERLYQAIKQAGNERAEFRAIKTGDHNSLRWIDAELDEAIADFYRRGLSN